MPRASVQKNYDQVIAFLQAYFAEHNCVPTYEEIVAGARLSSKCQVKLYLEKLIQNGLARQEPGKPRSLQLTERGRSYPRRPEQRRATYISKAARINAAAIERTVALPVVGRTFAGLTTPIPNADFSNFAGIETIEVSEEALPGRGRRDEFFGLEVRGDSMIEAGIFNGDYVICRKSETAENNQMVVALLTDSNETTLKYFHREANCIRLQPANSAMQPIVIHDTSHLIVQGVVVLVVHCRE